MENKEEKKELYVLIRLRDYLDDFEDQPRNTVTIDEEKGLVLRSYENWGYEPHYIGKIIQDDNIKLPENDEIECEYNEHYGIHGHEFIKKYGNEYYKTMDGYNKFSYDLNKDLKQKKNVK